MFVALVKRLTAPTSATTTFGKARLFLGIAPKRTPQAPNTDSFSLVTVEEKQPSESSPPRTASPALCEAPGPKATMTQSHIATKTPDQDMAAAALAGPILPTAPPYWKGDPTVVPEPAELRRSAVCNAAAFAGAQLWAAAAGTAAANLHATGAERERYSSAFRQQAWKTGFMERHSGHFADNPTGARSYDQFHVGYFCVPEIRALAHAELRGTALTAEWFPWMRWVAASARVPALPPPAPAIVARDGYCYADIAPYGVDRVAMCASLGAWPTVAEIIAWFADNDLPRPALVNLVPTGPGRYHVVDKGGSRMRLDGTTRSDPTLLPFEPGARIGGSERVGGAEPTLPDDGSGGVDSGGSAEVSLRWVLVADTVVALALERAPAVRKLTTLWGSVRLKRVHARLVGNEEGSVLAVGIGSPATRMGPTPAPADADLACILASEEFVCLDAIGAGVGVSGSDVRLPAGCDLELSARRAPNGGLRPDVRVNFVPSGSAQAVVTFTFVVGGGALMVSRSADLG